MFRGFKLFTKIWKENIRSYLNQTDVQQAPKTKVYSTMEWNSQETANKIYSDREIINQYLDDSRLGFYKKVAAFLPEQGVNYDGSRIADVGCGTGHLLLYISQDYSPTSLTGYDYSEEALKIARETFHEASFQYLDIYTGTHEKFNVVFCLEVLEHLLYPEKALRNLIDMTILKGFLFITVPDGRQDNFEGHINFWSLESWKVFMERECNGLQITTGLFDDTTIFTLIRK